MSEKEELQKSAAAAAAAPLPQEEPAPAYEQHAPESSAAASASTSAPAPAPTGLAPTVDSPFDFPSNADLPPYSPQAGDAGVGGEAQRPIAIPQTQPGGSSSFVQAYPPALLQRGITAQAWRSFVTTMSAFLTAKVSDRAISHAADIGKQLGKAPTNLGKGIANHAKSVGKNIGKQAKRGNIIGAAAGVVGGSISLPINAALGTVGAILSLPGTAVGAITKKPQTPQQRAAAYAAAANAKWLHERGLHVEMLSSGELALFLQMSVPQLFEPARSLKGETSAGAQLRAMEGIIAALDADAGPLVLDASTLWLVVVHWPQ